MIKQRKLIGFTLVELMVVIVIIAVLVALAIPRLMTISSRTRASECRPVLNSIVKTQQAYYAARDRWGSSADSIGIDLPLTRNSPNGSGWFQYDVMIPSGGVTAATGILGAARTYRDGVVRVGSTDLLQDETVICARESGRQGLKDPKMGILVALDVDPLCSPASFSPEN